MKYIRFYLLAFGLIPCHLMGMGRMIDAVSAQVDRNDFVHPPLQARPSTYWEWMNGNISRKGLTTDLEYMKRAYYGSAMMFEAGVGIPRGAVDYNSSEWKQTIIHAVKEAERLGMRLSMHNSPGYSGTGGPWITPEYSMKQLEWTDAIAQTDKKGNVAVLMPRPYAKMGFYRDAYVLAYPSLPSEKATFSSVVKHIKIEGKEIDRITLLDNDIETQLRLEGGQKLLIELNAPFEAQAATVFRGKRERPLDPHDGPRDYPPALLLEASDDGVHFVKVGTFQSPALRAMDTPSTLSFAPIKARWFRITTNRGTNLSEVCLHSSTRLDGFPAKINALSGAVGLKAYAQKIADGNVIHPEQVIDVTQMLDADGHLRWKAPHAGRWTFVRIGYTTTGEVVAAAPDSGIGLDCDKLSKEGVDRHFSQFLFPLLEQLRPWCGKTLESLVIDSWEAGKQNWTESLPAYFKSKRGYDIMPHLLAVTGRIVGSVEETERFLWDFRRTHTDMFLENYIERFKYNASKYGLTYAGEAYGDGNFESLEMAARQDVPMSEFWTHYIYGNITTTMLASSTAHVWGKPVVACEAFTGTPFNSKFTEHPYGMKALADYIMTAGVNRLVYHATTHQPYTGNQPGNLMTMGPFGTHLDRTSTWASQFGAFNLYVSRCCYLLRQGRYVADVLYLKDESISSGVPNYNAVTPATPYGYRWDIASAEALNQGITIGNEGRIALPSGMNYRLMVVPSMERTSPQTLRCLLKLVQQGMHLFLAGNKPLGYLGLDSVKDQEVKLLADSLWQEGSIGKGRVYLHGDIKGILAEMNVPADFAFKAVNKDAQIHFIHRTVGDEEVYFITNHRRRPEPLTVTCRVLGKVPTLWNAETGETDIPVSYQQEAKGIKLNLNLSESGSIFIVFRLPKNGDDVSEISSERRLSEKRSSDNGSSKIKEVVTLPSILHTHQGDNEFPADSTLNSTFSLSLWAKPETFAAAGRGFLLYPAMADKGKSSVGISMGQNGIRVYERCGGRNLSVIEYMKPVEGWTHLVLTYLQGLPILYVNGKAVATGKKSAYDCLPAIDIPMTEEQYVASFEGDQTQAVVYDYVLSDAEIAQVYHQGLPAPRIIGVPYTDLSQDWRVGFPAWSKAPSEVALPRLQSLHKHADFNVRHFSGTATYRKVFTLTRSQLRELKNQQVFLELGRVENMAEVSVNGSKPILLWKAPYSCDVTSLLHQGKNELVIQVTNLYPNRLIGDEHLPEKYAYDRYGQMKELPSWYLNNEVEPRERVLFSTWKHYKSTDPLLEAGLVGPILLTTQQ